MLKNISRLECKVDDKTYQFFCEMDAPIVQVKDVLLKFFEYVSEVEKAIKQQQEELKSQEEIKTEDILAELQPA